MKFRPSLILSIFFILVCAQQVFALPPKITLHRVKNSQTFDLIIKASTRPKLSLKNGYLSRPLTFRKKKYFARVTPKVSTGEILVTAKTGREKSSVTALVFRSVSEVWDQPEAVPGLVNTGGSEDSLTVSPDGNWLIVGTYSPVDMLCCLIGDELNLITAPKLCPRATDNLAPDSPSCNISVGPSAAPARPAMFGASRVVSSTKIHQVAPAVGVVLPRNEDFSSAIPPVSSFVFRKQRDGSFRQPFVIGFDMDGYTWAPFKFTFLRNVSDNKVTLQFSSPDPTKLISNSDVNKLYRADVVLGQPNILAKFRISTGGETTLSDRRFGPPVKVGDGDGEQGNSFYKDGRLWFDSERDSEKEIYVAVELSKGVFGEPSKVAMSESGVDERQPYFQSPYLYFYREGSIARAKLIGSDPTNADSWAPVEHQLTPDTFIGTSNPGAIIAVGEPNIVAEGSWLYFVYFVKTSTGVNANIGRVHRRE